MNEHAKAISVLFGAYGKSDDLSRQLIYCRMCRDIPLDLLKKTVEKLILESRFLPTVAEIVEASKSLLGSMDDNKRIKGWEEAWAEIEKAMHTTAWGRTPKFSTPEIAKAVDIFGWYNIHTCSSKDFNVIRAQVRDIYKAVCARRIETNTNNYLLGSSPSLLGRGSSGELMSVKELIKGMGDLKQK